MRKKTLSPSARLREDSKGV